MRRLQEIQGDKREPVIEGHCTRGEQVMPGGQVEEDLWLVFRFTHWPVIETIKTLYDNHYKFYRFYMTPCSFYTTQNST